MPSGHDAIDRRAFLRYGTLAAAAAAVDRRTPAQLPASTAPRPPTAPPPFDLAEATVAELQQGMRSGRYTARGLCEQYLSRIDAVDRRGPAIRAVLETNPDAIAIADSLDAEHRAKGPRGPLHGIPVLIKDNVATADRMATTAGSLSLVGARAPRDAFVAERLRAAGAVILGKTNLSEWANFRSSHSSSGWSARGGQCRNPYALDRSPCGSSSGSAAAVAASCCAVAVGTETDGSIVCPSAAQSLVGIKPTLGLVSRSGILPISADQDTAGPLARTVGDAARLLGVLAGFDPDDAATEACLEPGNCFEDYTQFLDATALQGARIAVPPVPGQRRALMTAAAAVLTDAGASVQTIGQLPAQRGACASVPLGVGCSSVLLYGFQRDLNGYLAAIPNAPVGSLAELIAANQQIPGALRYGQSLALAAQALDLSAGSADTQRYQTDRARDLQDSRAALDGVYAGADGVPGSADDVDALLFSANTGAGTPAMAGYPSISVPGGFVPADATSQAPYPSGVTFSGPRFSEPRLIALAYAFEQLSRHRQPPASTPALPRE